MMRLIGTALLPAPLGALYAGAAVIMAMAVEPFLLARAKVGHPTIGQFLGGLVC